MGRFPKDPFIEAVRKAAGLTRVGFATNLGWAYQRYEHYEKKGGRIRCDQLNTLERASGLEHQKFWNIFKRYFDRPQPKSV